MYNENRKIRRIEELVEDWSDAMLCSGGVSTGEGGSWVSKPLRMDFFFFNHVLL